MQPSRNVSAEMENGNPALLTAEGRAALTLTPQHHHQQERNCLQMLVRKYKLKCQCCWYSVFRGPSAKFQKVEKKWRSVEREPEAQLSIQENQPYSCHHATLRGRFNQPLASWRWKEIGSWRKCLRACKFISSSGKKQARNFVFYLCKYVLPSPKILFTNQP